MTHLRSDRERAGDELVRRLREAGIEITDSCWRWSEDADRWEFILHSPAAVSGYRVYEAAARVLPDGIFADELRVIRPR